jgi:hypothetical protein
MVDEILKEMSPKFAKLDSDVGSPSIAPELLLRSLLLQIFYSVRSERMLIEQLQYNMLFRWFVGMESSRVAKLRNCTGPCYRNEAGMRPRMPFTMPFSAQPGLRWVPSTWKVSCVNASSFGI